MKSECLRVHHAAPCSVCSAVFIFCVVCLSGALAISVSACELGTRWSLGWHTGSDNHHLSCSRCANEWNLFILQSEHCLLCIKYSYKPPLWAVSHRFRTFLLLVYNQFGAGEAPSGNANQRQPAPTTRHLPRSVTREMQKISFMMDGF